MKSKQASYASQSPLGDASTYAKNYNPDLLFAIARSDYRSTLRYGEQLTSAQGSDLWHCYEISWLDTQGKPVVYCAELEVSANSAFIIESKSLKLYLTSLNQHCFESLDQACSTIQSDLGSRLKASVELQLLEIDALDTASQTKGVLLDTLPVSCKDYRRNAELLKCEQQPLQSETLVSHLLRSNCPVTNQPDWATLTVEYSGQPINHEGLLGYIVSYREHSGFHEQCVEQIYCDIMQRCKPDKLLVSAQYTRRGGIDINPTRANYAPVLKLPRVNRQ
jgi:7-cyano-7-deazaguanine reductase